MNHAIVVPAALWLVAHCPHGPSHDLFGPRAKQLRREILTHLLDRPVKASECGFYKVMDAIYAAFPVSDWTCQADRDDRTTQLIRTIASFNTLA